MAYKIARAGRGILTADQLRSGDHYELHEGHPIYCAPTGSDGAQRQGLGFSVLDTDPAVKEAGIDAGYSPEPGLLRAPDIAIGNVPDQPGWIKGVPPLAVEYAGAGQDEPKLLEKIDDLLDRGTQLIWVVRLMHPVHVEVHRLGRPVEHISVDGMLTAPGILQNPVPVRALIDREAAHEVTLRNLLQRHGYDSLEAVRQESKVEGKLEGKLEGEAVGTAAGLRLAVADLCEAYGVELSPDRRAQIEAASLSELQALRVALKATRRWP